MNKSKIIKKTNGIFIDMPLETNWEFLSGLEETSGKIWEVNSLVSNEGRTGKLSGIIRYCKYFYYSFIIFLDRNKYEKLLCWQSFYGIICAFYCRIFHVKKTNKVIVLNFVYKPKGERGLIGKLYFKWLNYCINNQYIDLYISASLTNCKYCANIFNSNINKFKFIPFSVKDSSSTPIHDEALAQSNYILSLGRSNRDWQWLIESFRGSDYNLIIICDELRYPDLPDNITVLNNVWGDDTFKYIKYCKCMIIPILVGSVASGDTVLVQGMSFSKPIIITQPSCLADDYVKDGWNGLTINKVKEDLLIALHKIYTDDNLYHTLSENARKDYLTNYTLLQYGKNVGKQIEQIVKNTVDIVNK
ncbi:MAG: hypothetical protein EZS26_001440 [Candidatus Ordinivivax streblomastigis]|uniref:Glycosyl transferase family 1 domain-containing protein n=1 Tax=Candidatus Ordinivivax streblomastigis TaxID=2540710 RepID=A0A5M8P1L5_9BACT|nr:MAG: hypothetical protein EZS26_001440 [Candidatus Ordinivivax streblomastigis]